MVRRAGAVALGAIAVAGLGACAALLGLDDVAYAPARDAATDVAKDDAADVGDARGDADAGACRLSAGRAIATVVTAGAFSRALAADESGFYTALLLPLPAGVTLVKCRPGGCEGDGGDVGVDWSIPFQAGYPSRLDVGEAGVFGAWVEIDLTARPDAAITDGGIFTCASAAQCAALDYVVGGVGAFVFLDSDERRLVWTEALEGRVEACDRISCASSRKRLASSTAVGGVVLAGGDAIWQSLDTVASSIKRCPAAGCPDSGPETLVSGLNSSASLAERGDTLGWTQESNGLVRTCSLPGCNPTTTLAQGELGPVEPVLDDCAVYWLARDPDADAGADAGRALDAAIGEGGTDAGAPAEPLPAYRLRRCALPACAGGPVTIATGFFGAEALAVTAKYVYVGTATSDGLGAIYRVAK
jgi:hypothetical protein